MAAPPIKWRLHTRASPEAVWALLTTDEGRRRFWAESADERHGLVRFVFPDGTTHDAPIIEAESLRRLRIGYSGGSIVTFELEPDGAGGCELTLTDEGVPPGDQGEVVAGWVSVLLALKAAVDHGVDLRNHDPSHSWARGYCDN